MILHALARLLKFATRSRPAKSHAVDSRASGPTLPASPIGAGSATLDDISTELLIAYAIGDDKDMAEGAISVLLARLGYSEGCRRIRIARENWRNLERAMP